MKYDLLQSPRGRYWWHDAGPYWMNRETGERVEHSSQIVVIESVDIEDVNQLDHAKTDVLQPLSEMGWLSPGGLFYGCHSHNHDLVARLIIKMPVANLERLGWGRVQNKIIIHREPTMAQQNWAFDTQREFQQL